MLPNYSYVAGADLSEHQYRFVVLGETADTIVVCPAGEIADGVLLNDPEAGEAAAVAQIEGDIIDLELGATCALGAYVIADSVGRAVPATDVYSAKLLKGGVLGDIVKAIFRSGRSGSKH